MGTATRILVLGASGMLGSSVFKLFAESPGFEVVGTLRSANVHVAGLAGGNASTLVGVDVEQTDSLISAFERARPDVVINCIGLVKQLAIANDPLHMVPINALLPHRLARLAALANARLVHISTDCVFTGSKGNYLEADAPDALDLYGRSKLLGEVDYAHAVTLRTSIIGPEHSKAQGLVGWFLAQQGSVKGYTKAVFSGLPTAVLAQVIRDHVLPRPDMRGVWHVSAAPIAKYDLLGLVAHAYGKTIDIVPDDQLVIDRSLDSSRFRAATGWQPDDWPQLISTMRNFG
jgi:dTDP-4-dehydrorhamnose reductase